MINKSYLNSLITLLHFPIKEVGIKYLNSSFQIYSKYFCQLKNLLEDLLL